MLAVIAPFSQHDAFALVVVCFVAAVLMYVTPSCNHPQCAEQHRIQSVKERSANIERNHAAFHSAENPSPVCSLCQARKRE